MWQTINQVAEVVETWTSLVINLLVIGVAIRLRMSAIKDLEKLPYPEMAKTVNNYASLTVCILLWSFAAFGIYASYLMSLSCLQVAGQLFGGMPPSQIWIMGWKTVFKAVLFFPVAAGTILMIGSSARLSYEVAESWDKPWP